MRTNPPSPATEDADSTIYDARQRRRVVMIGDRVENASEAPVVVAG